MNYYSTSNKSVKASLEEAVLRGLAPDGGLYMPESIHPLPSKFFDQIESRSFEEVSFEMARHLLNGDVADADVQSIVHNTIQFDAPVVQVEEGVYALELFHGPTMAFKDFGARFLSGLLGHFARKQSREVVILAATSGDTGSAVANGFLNVKGTRVVVLYPSGKVSEIQEKQFTTLGANVTALEIAGTFDDCQRMVKEAFTDATLQRELFLTSANSINIGRLLPQTFYYFRAFAQLKKLNKPIVFAVPSGNFGDLFAGLLAKRLGLPVQQFIAATNINDVVPAYLQSGLFEPRASRSTISNAMDVGNPSNFARLLDLYQNDITALRRDIKGYAFSDNETAQAMKDVFRRTGYLMDPHGAVGYLGLKKAAASGSVGVFLETAHPGKFKEVVEQSIEKAIQLPDRLQAFMNKPKQTIAMKNSFADFKTYLLSTR
ncbi:MAG: threonine synthase [Bacteroidota bacterium]